MNTAKQIAPVATASLVAPASSVVTFVCECGRTHTVTVRLSKHCIRAATTVQCGRCYRMMRPQ